MLTKIKFQSADYTIDLSKPLDISIPIDVSRKSINAWSIEKARISPVSIQNWEGSVKMGASVNFNDIKFNPHSHITHTECVGHITRDVHSINKNLSRFFFFAELISVKPELIEADKVIVKEQLEKTLKSKFCEAIIIRTLPNSQDKKSKDYSGTNPAYLSEEGAIYLRERGIRHLLIDLPSIDKENDQGKLLAHNAFWNTSTKTLFEATITEFIYVPDKIIDGNYLLNLMIAPFENDATPSKPILYKIERNN